MSLPATPGGEPRREAETPGVDLIGLCPFYDDKEPLLVITPKQNLWHCLGACQRVARIK
ncbi:MAG: hypothetical protein H6968_04705 [Chromatiaceae bacterium]|nr:hypothetical protein [Chromatiaceae bacterium]